MTEDIVSIISQYGLETIMIAVLINIATALIKMPIKYFANKTKHSARITRFIVILPLIIGFVITLCYMKFIVCNFSFGKEFVTLWLTSGSLSLTVYAVIEKMIPSKKSVLQDNEAEMTEKIIDKLQTIADGVFNNEQKHEQKEEHPEIDKQTNEDVHPKIATNEQPFVDNVEKIVLRGCRHVQNGTEK